MTTEADLRRQVADLRNAISMRDRVSQDFGVDVFALQVEHEKLGIYADAMVGLLNDAISALRGLGSDDTDRNDRLARIHAREAGTEDELVTMQAAEPAPPGEAIPSWPPSAETLPPLEDPPEGIADLAQIVANLGLTFDEAARRLNANPLVDLRADRDVLEAAVAAEIAGYAPRTRLLGDGAIRAIARAAVSRQLELADDVLNRPDLDVRTRLTGDETGWL